MRKRAFAHLRSLFGDPVVAEGARAVVRTAINAAVAVGDLFPGVGLALSGGADLAKAIARAELWARRAYVKNVEGGDPRAVKMSSIDLTPDVSLRLAVGSELFECFSAGFLPTHAIEGGIQLWHDLPRMRKAYERLRSLGPGGERVIDVEISSRGNER